MPILTLLLFLALYALGRMFQITLSISVHFGTHTDISGPRRLGKMMQAIRPWLLRTFGGDTSTLPDPSLNRDSDVER
jgi:hypothetical protein